MQDKLHNKTVQVLDEKKMRRAQVAKEIEKRRLVERTIDDLYGWIDELHVEITN